MKKAKIIYLRRKVLAAAGCLAAACVLRGNTTVWERVEMYYRLQSGKIL